MKWPPTTRVVAAIVLGALALLACRPGWSAPAKPAEPDAGAVSGSDVGARLSDAATDSGGRDAELATPGRVSVPTLGAPASVGTRSASGRLRLHDDGFEGGPQSCRNQQCLTGGISP